MRQMSARSRWRSLAALALAGGALLAGEASALEPTSTTAKARPRVKLGEVSAAAPADARVLRASFEAALLTQTFPAARPGRLGARAIVSAAVLSCDPRSCAVSAVLRDEAKGNVLAILQSSAKSPSPTAREALLRSAAEGAVKQIPKALE